MYADDSTVRAARAQYFAANGFSDAGYHDNWVKLKVGPFPVAFPNTSQRKRAIPLHDLHHVATGYATTFVGEAEIGAWEIGGSCTNYWAAWALNAGAFGVGLWIAPRRVYRAFVRGRHSKTLYRLGWDDAWLEMSVGELRHRLDLDDATTPVRWSDRVAFAVWIALVASPALAALGIVALLW